MFYSVSCGASDACSIIRGRFQRRHVRSDVILRKRLTVLLFKSAVSILICSDLVPNDLVPFDLLPDPGSEGSFFSCFGLYLSDWPGLAGGIQGWFIHSGTSYIRHLGFLVEAGPGKNQKRGLLVGWEDPSS